nr:hypothetical protein [Dechloromonas sp.]
MILATDWAATTDGPGASLRAECRSLARKRALLAAASSLIPIPGIDLATDLTVMTHLIRRINAEFGLDEAQIGRLSGPQQALVQQLLTRAGGTLAVRLTTPALLGRILGLVGIRLTAMEAARFVPVAGQIAAAGIGYWSVKTIALRHIAHCEKLVAQLEGRPEKP